MSKSQMSNLPFFVIDFETGGLDPRQHDPVQVAVQVLDPNTLQPLAEFSSYMKPDPARVSPEALAVNNLTLEQLADSPSPSEVLHDFVSFLEPFGKGLFVAHNAKFDYDFLQSWAERNGSGKVKLYKLFDHRIICTVQLAFTKFVLMEQSMTNVKLTDLTQKFNIKHNAHEAMSDVQAAAEVLRMCLKSSFTHKLVRGVKSAISERKINRLFESLKKHY